MKIRFFLCSIILKNALLSFFLLMSNSNIIGASSTVEKGAPAASVSFNNDAKLVEGNAVIVNAAKKEVVIIDSKSAVPVVDATKKVENQIVAPTNVGVVVDPAKKVDEKAAMPVGTNVVVDLTKVVEEKKASSVVDKNAPLDTRIVADNIKKVAVEKVVESTLVDPKIIVPAVVDKTAVVPVIETKKDVPASILVSGSFDELKTELLAELTKVIQKQVKEEVSTKMVNAASVSGISSAAGDLKSSVVTDVKDEKGIVQKSFEVSAQSANNKTPCHMLTSATCGQNASECLIFKGYCLPKCETLSADVCEKVPNCKLSGLVTKTCSAIA